MKITYLGHAAFILQIQKYNVVIDPFISQNPVCPIKVKDIKPDYILVTHGHSDHLGDTVEIAKANNAVVVSVFEIGRWLEAKGLQVHSQHIGGGFHYPFGYLKLTLALHGSSLPDGSYGGNPCGFLLKTNDGVKAYFAGDTGLFGDMALIGEEGIDIAALPVGDNYTMGPQDALRAVKFLHPKYVIPMHYDTFDLIRQDIKTWKIIIEKETSSQVVLMKPGEHFDCQN